MFPTQTETKKHVWDIHLIPGVKNIPFPSTTSTTAWASPFAFPEVAGGIVGGNGPNESDRLQG